MHEVIRWLTGYTEKSLNALLADETDFETFFARAPKLNPSRNLIQGVICGVRIEEIKEPLMREIRYLDKLVDELSAGRAMEKILRKPVAPPVTASAEKTAANRTIAAYHQKLSRTDQAVCDLLAAEIDNRLSDAVSKIWHGHPVWFLDGNPIVGYSHEKLGMRLMFWSGADFGEPALNVVGKKFKDASIFYHDVSEIRKQPLRRWLSKAREIQWDYKNLVKRRGVLERLTGLR